MPCKTFTIAMALATSCFVSSALAGPTDRSVAEARELAQTDERAGAEKLLSEALGPEFLDALAGIAPDSREELTGTFILMMRDEENAGIYSGLSIEILISALSRNAPYALSAADEDLKKLLRMQTRLAEDLLPDKALCGAYLAKGSSALPERPQPRRAAFKILAHLMQTLHRAMESGLIRREATAADWRGLVQGWHEAGATKQDVKIWMANDSSDERFCDVALSFQRYFVSAESDAAKNTRAEVARLMAERYGQEY